MNYVCLLISNFKLKSRAQVFDLKLLFLLLFLFIYVSFDLFWIYML